MAERAVHFIPARMTREEWEKCEKVPYRGELLIEVDDNGSRLKIGDGLRPYRDLPYVEIKMEGVMVSQNVRHVAFIGKDDPTDTIPNETLIIEESGK